MSYKVTVFDGEKEKQIRVAEGSIMLNALRDEGFFVQAPCGGTGRCGKCTAEIQGLGEVLTCQIRVDKQLQSDAGGEIYVKLQSSHDAVIESIGLLPAHHQDPLVWELDITLDEPKVTDQTDDEQRVALESGYSLPWHLLADLPHLLRDNDFKLTALVRQDTDEICALYPPENDEILAGIAIDIGTTTISASLFDLRTGDYIKSANALNPQRAYGADVISRIDFAATKKANLDIMQNIIVDEILALTKELLPGGEKPVVFSLAGNTTMMHLLSGHDPAAIAKSPFIPVTLAGRLLYFHQAFPKWRGRLKADPVCLLLPSLSSYVGADVTAGIIASGLDLEEEPALLVDIGTNGEIVLNAGGKMVCCSVAAGPAFEGANITCGTGGVSGAIDKTDLEDGKLVYTTIKDKAPNGICGSGIVSVISTFLKAGIIDDTGRFCEEDSDEGIKYADNFREIDGQRVYVLSEGYETEGGAARPVYITQKDIREVQNAKAAVHAGIELLVMKAGLEFKDIGKAYIAGGFGNFIDMEEAINIGLLPAGLRGKTISAGNSSAAGSALCMLDYSSLKRVENISKNIEYYELSTDKEFTELYVDGMFFE